MANNKVTNNEICYEFVYSRQGRGVYFSHLDVVELILRTIRRSGVPYKITQGFNPRPKVSFGPPLPLGHSSVCEYFRLTLLEEINTNEMANTFNTLLPDGFKILNCYKSNSAHYDGSIVQYKIYIQLSDSIPNSRSIINHYYSFLTSEKVEVEIVNKENIPTIYNIKEMVANINIEKIFAKCELNDFKNNYNYDVLVLTLKQIHKMPSIGKAVNGIVNKYIEYRDYVKKVERYKFLK